MAKSFLEYVENRIVENFDYHEAAIEINTIIKEQGYITPVQLHELLAPKLVSKAAERLGGFLGGAKAVGGKLVGDTLGKIGSSFYNVGADTLKGMGKVAGAIGDYGADKLAKAQQYGADLAQAGAMGTELGAGNERMRQKHAVLGHEKAAAERLKGMGGLGSQEAGQRAEYLDKEMAGIKHITDKLTPQEKYELYTTMKRFLGAA